MILLIFFVMICCIFVKFVFNLFKFFCVRASLYSVLVFCMKVLNFMNVYGCVIVLIFCLFCFVNFCCSFFRY